MQRVALRRSKKANALTDPRPNFVSLVKAGANMTPFKSVVRHDGLSEEDAMHITAVRSDDHEVARITFKGDDFVKKSAVQAWLTAGGYEGYEIAEADGYFEVVGKDDLTDTRDIEVDGGIVITVGKIAVAAEKDEVDEAAAAAAVAAVVATKEEGGEEGELETAVVAERTDEPVAEPVAEAADAVAAADAGEAPAAEAAVEAPVAEVVETSVAQKTTAELVQEGLAFLGANGVEVPVAKGTYEVSEIGYILNSLYWLSDVDLPEGSSAAIKQAAQGLIAVLVAAMQDTVNDFVNAFKGEAEPAATVETPEVVAERSETEAEVPVVETEAEKITRLEGLVTSLAGQVEELVAAKVETPETPQDEGKPVARQTRKGADVDEASASSTVKGSATAEVDELRRRSSLGMASTSRA